MPRENIPCTPPTSLALCLFPASSRPVSGRFTTSSWGRNRPPLRHFARASPACGGDRPDSLHDVAYNYINTHGKDLHGEPLGKYFIHGLGHYVGLNVHDPNDYDVPLGPGAVFTLEPGIYIPEEKLGCGSKTFFMLIRTAN